MKNPMHQNCKKTKKKKGWRIRKKLNNSVNWRNKNGNIKNTKQLLQSELLRRRQIKNGGGSKNVIKIIFGFISEEHSLEREIKNKAKYLKRKK